MGRGDGVTAGTGGVDDLGVRVIVEVDGQGAPAEDRAGRGCRPGHGERRGEDRVLGGAGDGDLVGAGVDCEGAGGDVPVGEPFGRQPEGEFPALARLQADLAEVGEALSGCLVTGVQGAGVELDQFAAGPCAGVGHRHRDLDLAVLGDRGVGQPQVAVGEVGVGQPVAEGVERCGPVVLVGPAGLDDVVVQRLRQRVVAPVPGLRQAAGGLGVAEQYGCQGVTCFLPAVGGPHHGGQVLVGPVDGVRVAAHHHQRRLRADREDRAQQRLLPLGQGGVRAVLGLAAVDHRMVAEDDDRGVGLLGGGTGLGQAVTHQLTSPALGGLGAVGRHRHPAVGGVDGGVAARMAVAQQHGVRIAIGDGLQEEGFVHEPALDPFLVRRERAVVLEAQVAAGVGVPEGERTAAPVGHVEGSPAQQTAVGARAQSDTVDALDAHHFAAVLREGGSHPGRDRDAVGQGAAVPVLAEHVREEADDRDAGCVARGQGQQSRVLEQHHRLGRGAPGEGAVLGAVDHLDTDARVRVQAGIELAEPEAQV